MPSAAVVVSARALSTWLWCLSHGCDLAPAFSAHVRGPGHLTVGRHVTVTLLLLLTGLRARRSTAHALRRSLKSLRHLCLRHLLLLDLLLMQCQMLVEQPDNLRV